MSSAPLSDDLGRRAGFPWYYPVVFLLKQTVAVPSDTAYMEVQTKVGIGATTVTVGTEVEP